ncbi:MAG: NPCBM/NEW2 domain-containing protein [Verrucomicrobiales bacterium]|nr:NPCBM/NEW2 domain-containing protein [Verrucomicrobiales bacterium]
MANNTPTLFLTALLSLLILSAGSVFANHPTDATPEEVARAAKILADWHGDDRGGEKRALHLVYWTPNDKEPVPEYRERLSGIMLDIEEFYGKEMKRLGLGRRSIRLEKDEDQLLRIHLVTGEGPTSEYAVQSGNQIKQECIPYLKEKGIDPNRETIMIFCNLATWDEEKKVFRHKSPYYASGGPQGGTAWQLDSPTLAIDRIPLKEPIIQDGQYGRISLGKHNSIFIGGIAHELGHGLGLPHCRETKSQKEQFGTALMGSGNRSYGDELRGEGKGSFLTLAHGLRLASHPQFSGSTKGLRLPVSSEIRDLDLSVEGKQILAKGTVESSIPCYAIVAYYDPDGGSDYDAYTATSVPNENGKFQIYSPELPPGTKGELRLFPLLVNGSIANGGMSRTPYRFRYEVQKGGTPDLSSYLTRAKLTPLLDALRSNDGQGVKKAAQELAESEEGVVQEIGARFLQENTAPKKKASDPSKKTQEASLTDFAPASAAVGWGQPLLDRALRPAFLLTSGGEVFSRGVYAHAPSTYQWELGGKWKRLQGHAGMAEGRSGSVVFSIHGDGKQLWKSKTIKGGAPVAFDVNLTGVQRLKLQVDDAGDGNGSDWGLWLGPTLSR